MKKRNLLAIALIAVLAFTLGMGTIAAYKKTFSSPDNLVRAAKFEVDSNNTLDETVEFDLTDAPICPGFEDDIYEFEIDKKDTEVPVKYTITVTPKGDLFANVGNNVSPVKLILYRETDEGWVAVENTFEINPVENPVEKFKIGLNWGHTDYDIEYQGKTGKVEINVVAEQVDEVTTRQMIISNINKVEDDNNININIGLRKVIEDDLDCTVILNCYNNEGRPYKQVSTPISMNMGLKTVKFNLESSNYANGISKIKCLVWDNFDNMKPLADPLEVIFE